MTYKHTDIKTGLNTLEIENKRQNGFINVINSDTKSYKSILKDNIFTFFNLINVLLGLFILTTGSYRNMLFLGVMISNIIIGTFQEIRTKITLDKISLINNMTVCSIRNSKETTIKIEDIVLDDILKVKAGNQIVVDSIIRKGTLEIDESLLTGESDSVLKKEGDYLYSGSFIISGNGIIQVVAVGNDNYASKMVKDAKEFKKYPSELRDILNIIIKYIGLSIIPLGIIMFIKHYYIIQDSYSESVLNTSAALIGMIPEGLVILTSIALAVGVINLSKHKTLVQELYCLETLARVDVLCLDKTGTLTENKMIVDKYIAYSNEFNEVISNLIHDLEDDNPTIQAIKDYFKPKSTYILKETIPFNSINKYSGCIYKEGRYMLGAYSYMTDHIDSNIMNTIEEASNVGYRVITLMKDNDVLGHIYLLDKIREDAIETLNYFREQDVEIKIISGDHPNTVSHIAKRVGLNNYSNYVDMTNIKDSEINDLVEKTTIIGRVTPEQKRLIIRSLRKQGQTVGIAGDGVNDVLAFKEADVSIAMNSGSDIAKASANLVLLESNFDALPQVLFEGRRVINNIQRVATLFLTKTIFSILLTFITIFTSFEYPFEPIHLTFMSTLTIGLPAFFMALEPNKKRVENRFLENVIKVSIPAGISVVITLLILNLITNDLPKYALITIVINGCIVLTKVSKPYTLLRKIVLIFAYIGIILGLLFFNELLNINPINIIDIKFIIISFIMILLISNIGSKIIEKLYKHFAT